MLASRRTSQKVALTAVFAAVYFVLGFIPVFPLSTGGYLRANKVLAPLTGMLLGPGLGVASMTLGSFLFVAFSGQPAILLLGPLPLDFVPDATVALVSGLSFSGRVKAALAVPAIVILAFFLDPISVLFVSVGGASVPFAWFHILAVGVLAAAFILQKRGVVSNQGAVIVSAGTLAALLTGQLAGTLLGQNISVRFGTLTLASWAKSVSYFFFAYPVERSIYVVASILIALPVLKAVSRRTVKPTASG
ncbi:MAG: hypothetical protein HY296_03420 [Thaumarchaeota archaeon]|nr:hypothetical protein [Nitrososphaerota archaeon]